MTCLWDRPINRPDQGVRLPPRSGHQAWTFLLCLSLTILASLNMGQGGETPYPLTVVPLTRNLGDPRSPGNAKLVFSFPDQLTGAASSANTEDFQVYVYPEGLDPAAGTVARYRAGGLYLWRWRQKLFLDIRDLPHQEQSGEVRIRLLYAPEGEVLATGIADGLCRYQDDAVDVVLAVDVSRSMNYNDRGKLRVAAARTFIEMASLGGGVGRVGLVTFNHRAEVKTPLIPLANGERLLSDLSKVGAEGMTSLDAPLESALSLFTAAGSENPVVVLLTDGFNEGLTFQGSYQRLAAAGIRIFAVGLSESADHALLQEMARSTNGIYFRAPAANDLQEIYARLAAELGKRYLMHAQILSDTNGELTLPIDSTVVRAVAMADGGARLGLRGPDGEAAGSGGSDGNLGSVFVAKPRPGPWRFAWQAASPGSSAFALFGDTRLFLDLFPPQLQGKTLAFGATLAQGAAPVAGRVWLEPVPGLVPERIELFDDGRHGDGREADGVYGAWEIYNRPEVNRFDVILRSAGEEAESFIRQTTGLVLRTPEPEVIEPEIEGELDFGVLFPGETGIASLATRLNGNTPGRYSFELSWPDVPIHLPGFHSLVAIDPGYQVFDIELQVPLDATPGLYHGDFNIASENGPVDRAPAQVRVGEVRFSDPGEIDLGSVPPGTTIFRSLFLPVYSDKETGVAGAVAGDPGLVLSLGSPRLSQGDSSLRLELAVTPPLGTEGEQTGSVTLRAGASSQVIPVRWLVKAYAAPTLPNMDLPAGIPEPPGELAEPPPLAFTLEPVESDLSLTGGNDSGQPDDNANPSGNEMSPWDRAVETYRDGGGDLTPPESLLERGFPTLPASLQESSDSLWNAWWLYILAALILLLLLLALLSYILYRLGKSRWLRFLLVSLMANIILLIIFIALLGTGEAPTFTRPEAINVTLTQESAEGAAGGGSFASASSGAAGGGENDLAPEESYAGGLDRPGPETFLPENLSGSLPESELAAAHLTPLTATAPVTLETSASNRPRSGRSRQAADLSPVTPNLENVSSQETLETPEPLERREQDSQVPEAAVIDAATLSEELRPEDKEWLGPVLGRETGSELAEVAPPLSSLAQPNELLAQATELLTEPAENTDIRRPRAARRDNTGPGPFPEPRAISDDPRRDQPEGARQPAPPREPGQSEDPSPEPWNESARPSFAPERPEPETIREEATLPSPDLAAAFGARRENPEIARPRRPDHSGESHEPTPNEPLSRISPTPPDTATPTGGATPSVPEFRIPAGRAELGRENLEGELRPTPEPDGTIGDQSGISLDGQLADAENTDLAGGEFEPQPRRGARRGGRPEPALSSQPGSANNLESGSIPGDGNSTPGQAAEPGERRFPGGVGSGKPGDDTGEAKGESPGVASGGEGAEDG
ncbi:MAG: VWA domain-containing protein, partial [Planctomycetota bacterium]|nr:VWA domain-containing protein [Planctomycetota bacterium]